MEGLTIYKGTASFVSPRIINVASEQLEAERIFINVGARPSIPDFPGVRDVPYLTSTSILELEHIPEHLAVVGGSYVGLEFAQSFRRLGARVTVVERGARLISQEDVDVSQAVTHILQEDGIDLRLDSECIRLEKSVAGVQVHVSCREGAPVVEACHVLLAVGRTPTTTP